MRARHIFATPYTFLHNQNMAKVGKFLHAVMADWLARMSGPITVPFTIAAFIFPSTGARILFAVLAVIAGMVTCYRVWATEYDRAETEKAKNETAPHMDIRLHNSVPYSRNGETTTDLFFYLELVLGEPSQVSIQSFTLDFSDQGQSVTTVALEDVYEWQWIRGGNFRNGNVCCEPLVKELTRRGDPLRGWIHFPMPELSNDSLRRSLLTLNVNCIHGTCYSGIDPAFIQVDPDVKGHMWKKPKTYEATKQPGPKASD